MAIFGGDRVEVVPVKFSDEEKRFLEKIGADEDRARSYIVRQLTFRGLREYMLDGELRVDLDELEILAEKRKIIRDGQKLATKSKNKILSEKLDKKEKSNKAA